MAKARFGGGGWQAPGWPRMLQMNTAAPSLTTTAVLQLDAASERAAIIGHVMWADGATHNANAIRFRTANATSPVLTLRVSLRDPDTAAGPPGRDDGTVDQSATQVNPTANTNYELTLSATRSIAQGGLVAVVFDVDTYTSGAINVAFASTYTGPGVPHRPMFSTFTPSTWTIGSGGVPTVSFIADDGTVGIFANALPAISAAFNTHAINTGTTPDEVALAFTPTVPCSIGGGGFLLQSAANADYSIVLYEGTTAIQTVAVVSDTVYADATVRPIDVAFPDVDCTVGVTYYLALKPTTANNVTAYSMDCSSAAQVEAFAGEMSYAQRTDAGAWSATTTRLPLAWFRITASDDGASGGGGGSDTFIPTFRV